MNGWVIDPPKGEFMLSTFDASEAKCIDRFVRQNGIKDDVFTWWESKRKEGYCAVEISIKRISYVTKEGV